MLYSFLSVGRLIVDPIHYQAYYTDDEHLPIIEYSFAGYNGTKTLFFCEKFNFPRLDTFLVSTVLLGL